MFTNWNENVIVLNEQYISKETSSWDSLKNEVFFFFVCVLNNHKHT